jgi:hypothetical protein
MAKVTVAVLTLITLGVWGWMAWGEYVDYIESLPPIETMLVDGDPLDKTEVTIRPRLSIVGAPLFYVGIRESGLDEYELLAEPQAVADLRIALGAIVALSATLFFAVTGGSGAIFGVMVTAFLSFLAAAANMVFGLVFAGIVAWTAIEMGSLDLSIAVYAVLLYSGVVILASFAAMRQMNGLVRGRRDPMKGVMKSLLILMVVSGGLGPFGVVPQFAIAGFSGFYALAALCLLALLFIGLTHSNYEYD